MKRSAVIAVVALLVLVTVVLWLRPRPTLTAPQLAVRFLGLRSDVPGNKFATFELRNVGQVKFQVELPGVVEWKNPRFNHPGAWSTNGPSLRPSSPPIRIIVSAPATEEVWRIRFRFAPPLTLGQKFKNLAASLGLPAQRQWTRTFTAASEWLDPTVALDWTNLPGMSTTPQRRP